MLVLAACLCVQHRIYGSYVVTYTSRWRMHLMVRWRWRELHDHAAWLRSIVSAVLLAACEDSRGFMERWRTSPHLGWRKRLRPALLRASAMILVRPLDVQ